MALVDEARALLGWDWATMMPAGSAGARAEQMAELDLIVHARATDPELADLLAAAEDSADRLEFWQRANLVEMRRLWRHAGAVPADLVAALTKAASACEMIWREARPANDFARLRPSLARVLTLIREVAAAKAAVFDCAPYEALLDYYEPGGRIAQIDALFDDLAGFLPDFTQRVLDRQALRGPPLPLDGPFPLDRQRALGTRLMAAIGFPFDHGRLDESHHPFSGGTPEDLRITTRYERGDFTLALMATLHETGHALYEHGLPKRWRRQPVGAARGMSLHESQSLLIEMQVCRGREFLGFAAPLIRTTFCRDGPAWTADNLARHARRVRRGLIRVEADEVTYPAHVIQRTRLERAMIAGRLEVADLPTAWRETMAELVGATPADDRDGCMQDIHWIGADFGYFPTYTLGALAAAQLFAAAAESDAAILAAIATGDFSPLFAWLAANVHGHASSLSGEQLMTAATGRRLDTKAFKAHLRARYLED